MLNNFEKFSLPSIEKMDKRQTDKKEKKRKKEEKKEKRKKIKEKKIEEKSGGGGWKVTLVSVCVHFLKLLDTQTQIWTQSLTTETWKINIYLYMLIYLSLDPNKNDMTECKQAYNPYSSWILSLLEAFCSNFSCLLSSIFNFMSCS